MPGAFFERLRDYYLKVAAVLRGEAETSSIFPNTTDIGMSRERFYAYMRPPSVTSFSVVSFSGKMEPNPHNLT